MLEEDNARTGFFDRAEFDAILKHLPAYLQPPLEFMYTTGWRKSEVFSLTVARVDMATGVVSLEVGTTKSGEGRTFAMTSGLRLLLQKQLIAIERFKKQDVICPWVFHRPGGSRIKSFRGRGITPGKRLDTRPSCSTTFDVQRCGTSNALACRARRR